MPVHIRDRQTDLLVRRLARKRGCGLTEAVRTAVANELERDEPMPSMIERIAEIQREIARAKPTGLKADKAFFDELSGDS
ncbi:MAG TPA: type II toxin-antitoxin system VapB family antitoxin [Caulobacteraceae bacterium]|nr:type II toxin-antitoxin system VapB family antitoxin [Caulobacteraceae bacterium]